MIVVEKSFGKWKVESQKTEEIGREQNWLGQLLLLLVLMLQVLLQLGSFNLLYTIYIGFSRHKIKHTCNFW
jgi:hypothetical protein